MNISDRLKELRAQKSLTQEELAKATGLKRSAIGMYESGKRKPDYETLEIFADFYNVDMNYLMGWDAPTTRKLPILPSTITPAHSRKFPVLGDIACGQPIEVVEEREFIETSVNVNANYVLRCKGDSMINARIFDGDYVFIREQPVVENGEIAAVYMDNTVTLKRFYRRDGYIELRAENPMYKPIIIHEHDFEQVFIIGKAVAVQFKAK